MKILFIAAIGGLLAISCNDRNETGGIKSQPGLEHSLNSGNSPLGPDNGKKWKTDEVTRANVQELSTVANTGLTGQAPQLTTYHVIADTLTAGLKKLIRECTMKGPAHDALHAWLEPFMKTVSELKNAGHYNRDCES